MTLGFGKPTEGLFTDLQDLPLTVKVAWLAAQAEPDRADEILAELLDELRRLSFVSTEHLKGAIEKARMRGNAMERALEAADRRIAAAHTEVIGEAINPHGYYVYFLWGDDDNRPLYIGMSTNILARLGAHLGNRSRRPYVRRVTLTSCPNFNYMRQTEGRMIARFDPPWNVMGAGATQEPRRFNVTQP